MRSRSNAGLRHQGFVKTGEETYPCELTGMSATGATLNFEGPIDLPDRFSIQLTHDGKVVRNCIVSWREGTAVGVIFDSETTD